MWALENEDIVSPKNLASETSQNNCPAVSGEEIF